MSKSSFIERNKAIREAWNREQELVKKGEGTRDWSPKQQKDIIEKGRAYDDNGRAFEGQHMKSAEMYPQYQGEPANIQFLTREEHLEAHNGNWRNPTNWYFNPVTKEKVDFGEGPFIPCEIIPLHKPIVKTNIKVESNVNCIGAKKEFKSKPDTIGTNTASKNKPSNEIIRSKRYVDTKLISPHKKENFFKKCLKDIERLVYEHRDEIESFIIGEMVKENSPRRDKAGSNTKLSEDKPLNTIEKGTEIIEKASRNFPNENDVSGHKQRYHTKKGIVWKDKAPYHRGGTKY